MFHTLYRLILSLKSCFKHSHVYPTLFIHVVVPSGPPQNVTAITTSTTSIELSWDRPLLNETNGIIVAYRIRYFIQRNETTMERFNLTETGDLPNTTFFMEFPRLEEGVVYGFEVLAITVGEGPYSPTVFNETESAGQFAASIYQVPSTHVVGC